MFTYLELMEEGWSKNMKNKIKQSEKQVLLKKQVE